jgi:hypothetical protein
LRLSLTGVPVAWVSVGAEGFSVIVVFLDYSIAGAG